MPVVRRTTTGRCDRSRVDHRCFVHKKPYAFLGQYLVGHGAITEQQLGEAVRLQKENNALVGTIALAQGFLDRNQLNQLIKIQLEVDERIGKLAIEEGFMTEEQVDTVLSIQGRNHVYLGESLVRLGTISQTVLNEALRDFEAQIISQERLVREEISHLSIATEALVTLDVTLRFFYRLGYAVRVVGSSSHLPGSFDYLYCSEQIFKKTGVGYMGLGMAAMLAESITHGPTIREQSREHARDAMEAMSQLIFNLNYMACNQMKKRGIRVKHGAAFIDLPENIGSRSVCLELETVTSPMVLAYGGHQSVNRRPQVRQGLVSVAL